MRPGEALFVFKTHISTLNVAADIVDRSDIISWSVHIIHKAFCEICIYNVYVSGMCVCENVSDEM